VPVLSGVRGDAGSSPPADTCLREGQVVAPVDRDNRPLRRRASQAR
jgi:hypothetical protein